MTNEGVVTKVLPNNMAEVAVARSTACGGNCGSCEACEFQNELKTLAHNLVGASLGQKVVVETKSSVIFGAAMLVYVMPLIFFIGGYILAYLLGAGEGLCVVVSFAFLVVSAVILVMSQRRKKNNKIEFNIIKICEGKA